MTLWDSSSNHYQHWYCYHHHHVPLHHASLPSFSLLHPRIAGAWAPKGQHRPGEVQLPGVTAHRALHVRVLLQWRWGRCQSVSIRKSQWNSLNCSFQLVCITLYQWLSLRRCRAALLAYKLGNHQESYKLVTKSLEAYPNHSDSKDLKGQLKTLFTML